MSTASSARPTGLARSFGTDHPHVLYGIGAAEVALFAVIGAVIMVRSVAAGLVVVGTGIVCGAISAAPGWWSERHPEQARAAATYRRDRQTRLAQRHPGHFLVALPLVAAVDATLRWNTFNTHHHSILTWVIPAACGLVFGGALGLFLVMRARRVRSTF